MAGREESQLLRREHHVRGLPMREQSTQDGYIDEQGKELKENCIGRDGDEESEG
jgi:hypothetical protein